MNNENKYSIKLASGRERTFDSAAEMAKWIEDQREQSVPRGRKSARNTNRKPARKVRCYSKAV